MPPTNQTGALTGDDSPWNLASCRRTRLPIEDAETIPVLSGVLALWRAKCPDGGFPGKSDLDPTEIGVAALPNIILMDVENNPRRYRYRLTGTAIDRIQNRNLTGTFVDENRPEELRRILLHDLDELVESGAPHLVEMAFLNAEGYSRKLRILRLPLSGSADTRSEVAHIFLAFDFR
ncbi:MAG: PAS domain-containing protein [Alphaproteobacteria bacterium]|nr:PAS domain-containing protein [Alphaproteobacteria bacterium]